MESMESLAGFIFLCNGRTKPECYKYRVFGLPSAKWQVIQKIKPGMILFLFDFDVKLLYGVYSATSAGELNIQPDAFGAQFPAQVSFKIYEECLPLSESSFRGAILENYNKGKFQQELSINQVRSLLSLFRPLFTHKQAVANHLQPRTILHPKVHQVELRPINRIATALGPQHFSREVVNSRYTHLGSLENLGQTDLALGVQADSRLSHISREVVDSQYAHIRSLEHLGQTDLSQGVKALPASRFSHLSEPYVPDMQNSDIRPGFGTASASQRIAEQITSIGAVASMSQYNGYTESETAASLTSINQSRVVQQPYLFINPASLSTGPSHRDVSAWWEAYPDQHLGISDGHYYEVSSQVDSQSVPQVVQYNYPEYVAPATTYDPMYQQLYGSGNTRQAAATILVSALGSYGGTAHNQFA